MFKTASAVRALAGSVQIQVPHASGTDWRKKVGIQMEPSRTGQEGKSESIEAFYTWVTVHGGKTNYDASDYLGAFRILADESPE